MLRRKTTAVALAMALAACGKAPEPEPAKTAPLAAGPVNADPRVTTYVCQDGRAVVAGYPDPQTAVVTVKGHAYTLKIARSASGARYVGMGLQWWTKGLDHATLTPLQPGEEVASDKGVACAAAAEGRLKP